MCFDHRSMHGAELSARLLEIHARREPAEKLRHAMDAPVLHRRGEMMRAGDNVGNDFSIRGILDRGFEDADDSGRSIAEAAEPDSLADHGRGSLHHGRPATIGQDDYASSFSTVVLPADETTADGLLAHHLETGAVNDTGANFPCLAMADHGETPDDKLA